MQHLGQGNLFVILSKFGSLAEQYQTVIIDNLLICHDMNSYTYIAIDQVVVFMSLDFNSIIRLNAVLA
jgi:hypothetical protein